MPSRLHVLSAQGQTSTYPAGLDGPGGRRGAYRIWIFSVVFVLACVIGLTYTFSRLPLYRSTATLVMALPSAPGSETGNTFNAEKAAVQRQILGGHSLLTRVLESVREYGGTQPGTPGDMSALREMLAVRSLEEANLFQLQAEGPEPAILPLAVNSWIDVYLAAQVESERIRSNSTDASLRQQIEALEQKVLAKRQELDAFRQEYDIVSMERQENRAATRLRGLSEALNKAAEEEVSAEASLRAITDAIAQGKPVVRAQDERTMATLEQRAVDLREELKEYEQLYTPAYMALNPKIKAVAKKLRMVEDRIRQEREEAQQAALAEAEQALASAREATRRLRSQLAEYKQTVREFTTRFAEHEALQEELLQLEALYRQTKDSLVQQEVTEPHRLPKVTVLARAFMPDRPFTPDYLRDAGISVAASLVLGFLAVWFYEFFTRPARAPQESGTQTFVYRVTEPPSMPQPVGGDVLSSERPLPALDHPWPRELAESEVGALADAADDATRVLAATLMLGVSVEEAAALCWGHIDLAAGEIQVPGQTPRTVSMPASLRERFDRLAQAGTQADTPVWRDARGGALGVDDLDASIACAAHDAGVSQPSEVSAQSLRHTYLCFLVRQGIRLADLGQIAGYIPPTELATYGRLSPAGPTLSLDQVERVYPVIGT